MAIMIDKSGKNAKKDGKNISPNEVSELLRNFYQPDEAGIQNFDEFYTQLRSKMDSTKTQAVTTDNRDQIQNDYEKRERELKKMLMDMDSRDKTISKRKNARLIRLLSALILSSLVVGAGIFAYQYLHNAKTSTITEPKLSAQQNAEMQKINSDWQTYKNNQLKNIEELKLKFNSEMQKAKPDAALVALYERQVLEAKAALSQARTQMLLAKKTVAA